MDVAPIQHPMMPSLGGGRAPVAAGDGFSVLMKQASGAVDADAGARQAAEQLVATALVVPLLAEIRDQPLDAKLFHGGPTEDAFRQHLDTMLADRIVRSSRFPLVDHVHDRVMKRAAPAGAGVDVHA